MTAPLGLGVAGIGAWMHGAPDWPTLRDALLGARALVADAPAKPAALAIPAAERRRAPDGVRLAVEVAAQACADAGMDPAGLPCIFSSPLGELEITDYVCQTLAHAPLELSPTKFHNSVLNAPAGYWTIAAGCTAASSALTAGHATFAAGLLEAAVLACAEDTPVVYAACSVASSGPLAEITRTTQAFGAALVLVPGRAPGARLGLALAGHAADLPGDPGLALREVAGDNPLNADALALLAAFAARQPARLALRLSPNLSLDIGFTP